MIFRKRTRWGHQFVSQEREARRRRIANLVTRKPRVEALEDRRVLAVFNPLAVTADGAAGSLRDVIITANTNAQDDTINLEVGTYTLDIANTLGQENATAEGDLDLTEAGFTITFEGQGFGSTFVDQTEVDRVFQVFPNVTVIFNNLTIQNGQAVDGGTAGAPALAGDGDGGGILIAGDGDGGGILSEGTLTLNSSQLLSNTASGADPGEGGGGLFNAGTAILVNSEVRSNQSVGVAGDGGGILNDAGATLIVTNGAIRDNTASRAGGGIENNDGTATLTGVGVLSNSTGINGGGLHASGNATTNITGGIFQLNDAGEEGGGLWNNAGTLTINGTTLASNSAAAGNNGGNDQGGGAVFNNGGTVNLIDSTLNTNTADANLGNGGGVMTVGGTVAITGGSISGNLAERAGGGIENNNGSVSMDGVFVTGNSAGINGGGLHVSGAGTTDVIDGLFSGNTAEEEGGGLWNGTGTLTITNTIIRNGTASGAGSDQGGGGIFNSGGTVDLFEVDVDNNTADGASGSGGGIFNDGGTITVDLSTITNNTASRAGGGIEDNAGVSLTITDTTIDGNDAGSSPGNGGGLHITGAGNVALDGSTVSGNTAAEGGGLWNSGAGTLTIANSTISGNTATLSDGGGIFNSTGGTIDIDSATITLNDAFTGVGSGLAGGTGGVTLVNTIVAQNPGMGTEENLSGSINSDDFNLSGDADNGVLTGLTANTIFTADASLLPLLLVGGPTQTHQPAAGSPAIGFGSTTLSIDQRGVARPQGGADDIGAVEVDLNGFVINANDVPGDNAGDGNADEFLIINENSSPTGNVQVFVNSQLALSVPKATTGLILIRGSADDDTLIVDSSNGLIGAKIVFDGDGVGSIPGEVQLTPGGFDVLQMVGSSERTTTTYNPGETADAGAVFQEENQVVQSIEFFGLEPVQVVGGGGTLNVASAPLGIGFPQALNADNAINYTEGPNSNDPADPIFAGDLTGLVTVDGFESLEFSGFSTLNIAAGAGSDEINLNNPVIPADLATITVDGGDPTAGSDTVIVNGTVGADAIEVDQFTIDGARVVGAQPVEVIVTTAEQLLINGQGGLDSLTVTTPMGGDQIQYTPGAFPDSGAIQIQDLSVGPERLLPLSFQDLGQSGSSVTFANVGGAQDDLFIVGTPFEDTFFVSPSGSVTVRDSTTVPITPTLNTPGVDQLVLQGLAGDDTFNIVGDHPFDDFPAGIIVEGGSPDAGSDILNFAGSGAGAVTVSLGGQTVSEAGFGNVSFSGIETVNVDANAGLVVDATPLDDTINVTPTRPGDDGSFDHSGTPGVAFNYTDAGSVTFNGSTGTDVLNVIGDAGDNVIAVLGNDIVVDGSALTVGVGFDAVNILGLAGDDEVDLSTSTIAATVTVEGGSGDDNAFGTTRNADNTIAVTTTTVLVLLGGSGDDTLIGGSSADRLEGQDGDDVLEGAQGTDKFFGGDGSDYLRWIAGDGSDLMEGGTGDTDQLIFIANDGDQVLQLYGGGQFSNDLAGFFPPQVLDNSTRAIFELNDGQVFLNTGDVESVYIDALGGGDNIVINNQADTVSGAGNPISTGTDLGATSVQSVEVLGGDGDDYVEVHGTAGDDNLDVAQQGGVITVEGASVLVEIGSVGAGSDRLHLHGQAGNDNIKAADGLEAFIGLTLEGDAGDDVLSADAILIGGAGDDFLQGGAGDDMIFGNAGEDTIIGGGGNDTIDGGADFDTILIEGTSGNDVIDVLQNDATTLTHTVNGDIQVDTLVAGTVEEARVVAGNGADVIRVNWDDALGAAGDSLRMTVDGGDDSTNDRLVVVDDGGNDLVLYRKALRDDSGTVEIGPINAEPLLTVFTGIERVDFVDDAGNAIDNTGASQLVVFKHDPFESNDNLLNATYLGAGAVINVDPTIDPGPLADPFGDGQNLLGDSDFYRLVAATTGTLDFQVYFRQVVGLPNDGNLDINVRDVDGNIIAGFGVNDADNDERVRIPAVEGQTYYLEVFGNAGRAINVYNISVLNQATPVPYALELLDNPADGTTNPPGTSVNSDTGRSQYDNNTYDTTPTLFFRLDDGIFLHDLPGNPTDGTPPDEVIPIPFQAGVAQPNTPGYAIAIFDEGDTPPQTGTAPQTPLGFATAVPGQEGIYTFTVPNGFALSEGSNFLSARVQIIDPADTTQTGYGVRSVPLEIIVDTTPPVVAFGLAGELNDGLHPNSDSGNAAIPATLADGITNDLTPTFFGRAEANSIIRIYLDLDGSGALNDGDLLIGQTVANPLDGTEQLETPLYPNEPGGQWELTSTVSMNDPRVVSELGEDGVRRLFVIGEDVPGNLSDADDPSEILEIFLDTQGPRVTGVYITAFPGFDIFTLKPETPQPTPRVDSLTISVQDLPARFLPFFYPALSNVPPLAAIVLQGDHSGVIPIATLAFVPVNNGPGIAEGNIVLTFDEPLPDDRFTLTIQDNVIDPAGNKLDGENNAAEPIGTPFFPTGDLIPGGDFIARFTVDSRPEIATWSQGVVYADINGNFVWDPEGQDNDFTNRDFVFNFGEITDGYFAGNFAQNALPGFDGILGTPDDVPISPDDATSSGFDKIGAYGVFNGVYQFLLDTNDDGVGDLVPSMAFQVNAIPVAGNFFNSTADQAAVANGQRPRDEIGAFDGSAWYLDVDGNNQIDADERFPTALRGNPIVGDFNGDGVDDLGVYNNDTGVFTFDLVSSYNAAGPVIVAQDQLTFGFSGFGDVPVVGDVNLDGVDDIVMWVPGRNGQLPKDSGEFHFLVSDNVSDDPVATDLPSDVFSPFSPAPLGNDLIAAFGDDFALPLIGNFDPPIETNSSGAAFVASLTNLLNPLDTTGDGFVTARDALVVINALGRGESIDTSNPLRAIASWGGFQLDASEDGTISALDALHVINGLARLSLEGEQVTDQAAGQADWAVAADGAIAGFADDEDDLLGLLALDAEQQRVKA